MVLITPVLLGKFPDISGNSGAFSPNPGNSSLTNFTCAFTRHAGHILVGMRAGPSFLFSHAHPCPLDSPSAMTSALDAGKRMLTESSCSSVTSRRQQFPSSISRRSHQQPIFIVLPGCDGPAGARGSLLSSSFDESPRGKGDACAAGPKPRLTAFWDLPHCLWSAGVQGNSCSMCLNFATLATAIADRNLDAFNMLMFLHMVSAVSCTGLCPEAASEMSSHSSSWFWRTFACPEENTLLL